MPVELTSVDLDQSSIERYRDLLEDAAWDELARSLEELSRTARGRVIWNLNSAPRGGGVAELLGALIPYERGAGIDARWVAIQGSAGFFAFTKRLHRLLHGAGADGSRVKDEERREYEATLAENAEAVRRQAHAGDVVILHDPQVAGLAPALVRHGCRVVWRCHIGVDRPNAAARRAWDFLRPYVSAAHAVVFSRRAYVWEGLEPEKTEVIAPCIDAFSPKNRELDAQAVAATLRRVGVPDLDTPFVLQVSRWDPLKDPIGVLEGFASHIAPHAEARLVLAGPEIKSVADDPEEPEVWRELEQRCRRLPRAVRGCIHLAQLSMDDEAENALMVNALQRRAQVVVQKSLAEGFGLTVAEAMWKARPMVASRVGGIEDQIEDGRSGLLIDDPRDLEAFGRAVVGLLRDPAAAQRLGDAARRRITHQFLAPRHLVEQGRLLLRLLH